MSEENTESQNEVSTPNSEDTIQLTEDSNQLTEESNQLTEDSYQLTMQGEHFKKLFFATFELKNCLIMITRESSHVNTK